MNEFVAAVTPSYYISSPSQEIQLRGTRSSYGDVNVEGVSFHWPDNWSEFNPDQTTDDETRTPARALRLECAKDLANKADVPLIWIGDKAANWRDLSGEAEIGQILERSGDFEANTEICEIEPEDEPTGSSEMERRLQEIMRSSLEDYGTDKEKNQSLTPVQNWVRHSMPEEYTVMDVDMLTGDGNGNVRGLVELRRSDWPESGGVQDWWPWFTDRRQYYLLADTADRASIEDALIQHPQRQLNLESEVGYYTNLEHNAYSYDTIEKYDWWASEEKARKWLSFDDAYIKVSEVVNRLNKF